MNRPEWLQLALARSTVTRALRLTVVVGATLIGINHGSALLNGTVPLVEWLQIALTVVVPYLVSTYSTVQATMELRRGGKSEARASASGCC